MSAQPCYDLVAQFARQLQHFQCFPVRHESGRFVASDVALLAEAVDLVDPRGVPAERVSEALDGAVVMLFAGGAIAARGKGRGGSLQRSVVGDVEFSVGTQACYRCVCKIALDDREQRDNFLGTGFVLGQPAIS